MEADSMDFIGKDITYTGACVSSDKDSGGRKDVVADLITTDINYIQTNASALSKTDLGFVMVVYYNDGVDNIIHQEAGKITGNVINNAHLGWANLHYNYHRYGRILLTGNM